MSCFHLQHGRRGDLGALKIARGWGGAIVGLRGCRLFECHLEIHVLDVGGSAGAGGLCKLELRRGH